MEKNVTQEELPERFDSGYVQKKLGEQMMQIASKFSVSPETIQGIRRLYVFDLMRDGKESLHAYWALHATDAEAKFYAEVAPRNGDSWTQMLVTGIMTKSNGAFA
jgi:hypothetical protein